MIHDLACVVDDTPVRELKLSVRAYNCLHYANIRTIGELCTYSRKDLLNIKNLGKRTIDEIIHALKEFGIEASMIF